MEVTSHSRSEAQFFIYHISIWLQIKLTCYNVHTHTHTHTQSKQHLNKQHRQCMYNNTHCGTFT